MKYIHITHIIHMFGSIKRWIVRFIDGWIEMRKHAEFDVCEYMDV